MHWPPPPQKNWLCLTAILRVSVFLFRLDFDERRKRRWRRMRAVLHSKLSARFSWSTQSGLRGGGPCTLYIKYSDLLNPECAEWVWSQKINQCRWNKNPLRSPATQPPEVISLEFSDFLSATVNMEITFRLVTATPWPRATTALHSPALFYWEFSQRKWNIFHFHKQFPIWIAEKSV